MSDDENDEAAGNLILAMVCLKVPVLPLAAKIQEQLDALGEGPALESPEVTDGVLSFEFDGVMGFVSLMPAPFPWPDLEGPCATAWYWPEATETLKDHKAHLIVTLTKSDKDAIDQHLLMTRLVAAVAKASAAPGIYWGGAPLVQSADAFWETAQEADRDNLPLELWVEQRIFSGAHEKVSVFTSGMDKLGAMEVEVRDSTSDASELMELVFGISQYLVLNGNVINDGDTVGQSDEQKIVARHVDSDWERPGPVLLLEIE